MSLTDEVMEEFEQPFKEIEYEMNVLDRINAEIEESMKIPESDDHDKDFVQGFPFSDDSRRYKRHMDMIIRSCGITPVEFYKKIHDRIRKSKRHGSSRY
jgi:hypothetical protein